MNRRKFINSLLFAGAAAAVGSIAKAFSKPVYVTPGKLGYRLNAKGNQCKACKYFKTLEEDGECVLPAMRNAMKSNEVLVKPDSACSMFVGGRHKFKSVQQ